MRMLVLGGLLGLTACGGGGTTGANYADPPPMAEIVATPTPTASPSESAEGEAAPVGNDHAETNAT